MQKYNQKQNSELRKKVLQSLIMQAPRMFAHSGGGQRSLGI